MSLFLGLPTEVAAEIFSQWLTISEICKVETSLCSSTNRSSLRNILENSTVRCRIFNERAEQLRWLLNRKVKISSLEAEAPPTARSGAQLAVLLNRSVSSLTQIQLRGDHEVFNAVMAKCRNLEVVELEYFSLTQPFWDMLAESPSLVTIALDTCFFPKDINTNVTCPSVQTLIIEDDADNHMEIALLRACCNATGYYRTHGGFVDLSAIPSTLTNLSVLSCAQVGFYKLPASLVELSVVRCGLDDGDVESILKYCPNLTHLDLSHSDGEDVTEANIVSIGTRYAESLVRLGIADSPGATESALEHLCKKCTRLTDLDISKNRHLPESVYATILDNSPSLRNLRANFLSLSDTALIRIAQSPLASLELRDIHGYSEVGLTALLDGCKALQTIQISGHLVNSFVEVLWSRLCPGLIIRTVGEHG